MMWLRQSTAGQVLKFGAFLDSTDGNTQETGLTIANTDIRLTKNNSTSEVAKNSGGATHIANGRYYATFDATDSNTLGRIEIDIHVSGALAVHRVFMVVPAEVYDALVLGTDVLDVNTIQWLSTAVATPSTAGVPHVNTVAVSNTAQTANDNGADINTLVSRIVGTLLAGNHTAQTGDAFARLGTPAGASIAADLVVIDNFVDELESRLTAIRAGYLDNLSVGAVAQASVATEARLSELDEATSGKMANQVDIIQVDTTTDIPAQITTAQNDLDIITDADGVILGAAAVDLIWDEPLTGLTHNVQNSSGKKLRQLQLGAYEGGQIWIDTINGTAGTTDYENGTVDNPVDSIADATTLSASLGINRFFVNSSSSIALAQAYNNYIFNGCDWTLALGGQDFGGSTIYGANISGTATGSEFHAHDCSIGTCTLSGIHAHTSALSGDVTATGAVNYIFERCYSDIAGAGSPSFDFGASILSTNLNFRNYSGGIELKNMGQAGTDNASIEGRGQIIINASSTGGALECRGSFRVTNNGGTAITADDVARNVSDILADTNELQSDDVPGLIAALNDLSATEVLAQVDAALDTAIAELGVAAPAATPTLRTGLMLLYMMTRNRLDVDTTGTDAIKIYNNAGTQIASKAVTDDGTDYSEAEML